MFGLAEDMLRADTTEQSICVVHNADWIRSDRCAAEFELGRGRYIRATKHCNSLSAISSTSPEQHSL